MKIRVEDRSIPVVLGVNMHLQEPRVLVDRRYTESLCLSCWKLTIGYGVRNYACQTDRCIERRVV